MGGGGAVGLLYVSVKTGTNLPTKSFSGKCNSFCTISFENQTFKTDICKNTVNPTWNSSYTFEIFAKPSEQISLSIWEKGPLPSQDNCLGTLIIPLNFGQPFNLDVEQPLSSAKNSNVSLSLQYCIS